MTCYSTIRILRPHLRRLAHRIGRHVARHKLAHAIAAASVACVGTGGGIIALLPPTTARPVAIERPAPQPVSEPGTLVLLGMGVVGLVAVRGRGRSERIG